MASTTRLRVRTVVASSTPSDVTPPSLVRRAEAVSPLAFVRSGDGIVGVGEALRLEFRGAHRFRDAAAAWSQVASAAQIDDDAQELGSGLVAFGAFAFAPNSSQSSVLIVPRFVYGRRGDTAWTTTIWIDGDEPRAAPRSTGVDDVRIRLQQGAVSHTDYELAVARATERIRARDVEKVVLARDLVGQLPPGADLRSVLVGLERRYPDAITYAVDGVIGASPEMLIAASRGRFFTRVLAGSAARGATPALDGEVAEQLADQPKDAREHRFAVDSAMSVLSRFSADAAAGAPFPLRLPNLWHLATDITGSLQAGSSLEVLAQLHPTAAVGGTPTAAAVRLLAELEGVDRGRYAGPVGWLDAAGDGEWAIALRGAEVAPDGTIRAFAGAGIVADSVPASELAETKMKFRPIVEAFRDPLP